MKSIKYLGVALIATTLLGAAAPAFAAEEEHEAIKSGDTNTSVTLQEKVVDPGKEVPKEDPNPDPKDPTKPRDDVAVLKFVKAPSDYDFTSKIRTDGQYSIEGGTVGKGQAADSKFVVFSDAKGAHYHVKSVVKENKLTATVDGQTLVGTVSGFKINNEDIYSSGKDIVMDHITNPFEHAGEVEKSVSDIGITFTLSDSDATKVKDGTVFKGEIENTLYNVYSIAE